MVGSMYIVAFSPTNICFGRFQGIALCCLVLGPNVGVPVTSFFKQMMIYQIGLVILIIQGIIVTPTVNVGYWLVFIPIFTLLALLCAYFIKRDVAVLGIGGDDMGAFDPFFTKSPPATGHHQLP